VIELYTDGACSGNGKVESFGGYAIIVVVDGLLLHQEGCGKTNTTNNEMEMLAVLRAIELAKDYNNKLEEPKEIKIYSDSSYVVNTINVWMDGWEANNWIKKTNKRPPENLETIKKLHALMLFENNIKIIKVKGHAGNYFNEVADRVAVKQREIQKKNYLEKINGKGGL